MGATTVKRPAPETKPERKPLLDINTLDPERDFVTIDDVKHYLRLTQDFGATEHQQFGHKTERYDELWAVEKLTKAQEAERDALVEWLLDRVLVDAAALREQVGDRLTGPIKREIVLAFTNAPWLRAAQARAQEAEQETSLPTTGD